VNAAQRQASISAERLRLLESMPVPLAAVMMQQISRADRLFPVERCDLDRTLQSLVPPRTQLAEQSVQAFATLRLSSDLRHLNWRSDPAGFVEKMTADLWSTGQIGTFRDAAKLLAPLISAPGPGDAKPVSRFAVIVLDRRLRTAMETPVLFRMVRRFGTFFPHVSNERGMDTLERWIAARAAANPEAYAHWKVSGEIGSESSSPSVVSLSYNNLSATRQKLLAFFNTARNTAASGGPEGLRQALLHLTPEQIGLSSIDDPILRTFAMEIFTEGSGTQLYATTFVQWTIREALRRAQPRSILARFTPRSKATSMDWYLSHPEVEPGSDNSGSLIDAEMGTYLSYVNLMRLPDSEYASFLVWHEGYGQALLIGSGMPQATESPSTITLEGILALTT
jgi:hypothetical protein